MYECQDCGCRFQAGIVKIEKHNLDTPPFETRGVCPQCESDNYVELMRYHCRCCGAKLSEKETEYCSAACKKRGELLWERQRKRRRLQSETALYSFVKEIAEYNSINNTDYSYGQYVALVENKRRKQKCKRKKKSNT